MRLFGRTKDIAVYPQNDDVAQVRAKCAALGQDIAAAELTLRQKSLAAALGDDAEALEASKQLQALRDRREFLKLALAEAERIEGDRLAAVHAREWQARKRSLAQKAGQLERDAAEVARAITALQQGIRRMEEVGQSIVALCPLSMRSPARPYHELFSPVIMRDLVRLERFRLGDTESKPKLLGNYMQLQDPRTGIVKSMLDVLAEQIASVKTQFDAPGLTGPTAAKATPAPLQTAPETRGIVVDLRGVDLGVPKPAKEEVSSDQVTNEGVTANE
jgi:hypothetical protein